MQAWLTDTIFKSVFQIGQQKIGDQCFCNRLTWLLQTIGDSSQRRLSPTLIGSDENDHSRRRAGIKN